MIAGRMDRYIAASVLKAIGAVLLCLMTVVTLFTVVDELRDVTPGYTTGHAMLYMLYSSPRRLTELMPYGVFVGALIGLGVLASRTELTVLRASGVSLARLFGSAAAPALVLLGLNAAVAEYAAPSGEAAASTLKLVVQRGQGGYIDSAYWYREGDLVTSIDGYGADGELIGIQQFQVDGQRLIASRRAERAVYDEAEGQWLLIDVQETRFAEAGADGAEAAEVAKKVAEVRKMPSLPWRSDADPRLLSAKVLFDPAKLSFADLGFQIRYLEREGLDATRYQIAFWTKALQPVAVVGLVLLALGFVVGPLREAGLGARLAVGIAVGVAFKYLMDLFGPMSVVFGIPPWLAMATPVAVCWLVGAMLVRRAS